MLGFYAGLTHSSPLSWLAAELGADAQPLIEHSRISNDSRTGKTTDENLTSENWELILNLCDKVSDEGQEGSVSP